jgi:anoctamin-10
VESVAERVWWRGSKEEIETQRMQESRKGGQQIKREVEEKGEKRKYQSEGLRGGFWNGGEEGAREISRVGKAD